MVALLEHLAGLVEVEVREADHGPGGWRASRQRFCVFAGFVVLLAVIAGAGGGRRLGQQLRQSALPLGRPGFHSLRRTMLFLLF